MLATNRTIFNQIGKSKRSNSWRHRKSKIASYAFLICALVSILTTIGIVASLLVQAWPFFNVVSIIDFIFGTRWSPILKPRDYGVLPLVCGTMLVALISAAIAIGVAGVFGIYPPAFVAQVVAFAFGLAAASIFPAIVMGIFSKRMNSVGKNIFSSESVQSTLRL